MRSLLSIHAKNFLSLREVDIELQELSVLVGPNGAGKSNLLRVIQFLGDTARFDLSPAIGMHGGYGRIAFRGAVDEKRSSRIRLGIKALITGHSSQNAPDEYALSFWQRTYERNIDKNIVTQRREEFAFKRTAGRGRRITISGNKVEIQPDARAKASDESRKMSLASTSSGLSTLPRLGKESGGEQITMLAELFTTFRVFEVDVAKARQPSRYDAGESFQLAADASNLAGFLRWMSEKHPDTFDLLVDDLQSIVPSVKDLIFVPVGGTDDSTLAIRIRERGLAGSTTLSEASFGTIRSMALLAMLHDPNPPRITCVEEIDHGLHPHALDRIVERMRAASRRTQLLVVTHSPALANRLQPKEIVVCERELDTGESHIPAIPSWKVAAMARTSGLLPGELWFSGALGGGL
jgi:predicted ATPase